MAIFRGVGGSLDGQTETLSLPVAISQGGTGNTNANAGFNALAPSQNLQSGKYLKTNGTDTGWDNIDISTNDISGILPVVNGGTGATNDVDARVNLNLAKLGDNVDLTSITGLTGGISTVDYIDMDTTATPTNAVARFRWNDADGVPEVGLKGGNVTLQIGSELVQRVTNDTGVTLTDGQVVYVTGSTGNKVTVGLAQATLDSLSSTIIGVVTESIGHNQQGFVTTEGLVRDIDTSAFAEGALLWLSPTVAGAFTATKPTAPNHLVMVGYCIRSHPTVGSIFVKVQNGYEIGELHDVAVISVANNDVLVYDSTDSRWENKAQSTLSVGSANNANTVTNGVYTTGSYSDPTWIASLAGSKVTGNISGNAANVTGTVAVANGGTGATTVANARVSLLPSYTGNAGKVLGLNGTATDVEWISSAGSGSVTSVALSAPTGFDVSGSPITSTGTLALAFTTGYSLPTTASQSNWDTAYTDRLKWDGGSTGLNASTARTSLGLVIGTDVQAYDAQLADVAGLTPTDNGVIIGNGTNFVVESGTTFRSSVGLAIGTDVPSPTGTGASGTWGISITGNAATATNGVVTTGSYANPTWITSLAGSKISGNITGNAANVTGTVVVANGGTGATTLTGYVKGNGTSAMTASATISGTDIDGGTINGGTY